MKADITRDPFHPEKHFARVLMQQGRVQIDADWNEQAAILLRSVQLLARDLIGRHGGPVLNCGFVVREFDAAQAVSGDFLLSSGRYYVDGIVCEFDAQPVTVALSSATPPQPKQIVVASWSVDGIPFAKGQYVELFSSTTGTNPLVAQVVDINQPASTVTLDRDVNTFKPISLRRVISYRTQRDLPDPGALKTGGIVYLDVWERLITYVEDDAIREVALNGADTAARSKVVCQVKVMQPQPGVSDPTTVLDPPNRGFLRARSVKSSASTDPCTISPNARYRGPQNQLYRVEIHTGGTVGATAGGSPTFKWSRENGAVVFPIVRAAGSNSVVLETLGRDDRFGLAEGDWIEIQDDVSVLTNRADTLLAVQSIDRTTSTVTLAGTPSVPIGSAVNHPLLRRWDLEFGETPEEGGLKQGAENAAVIVENSDWLDLENGVQIQFVPPAVGQAPAEYRTGDYWLIPARVATGDVEWPTVADVDAQGNPGHTPVALPPAGIQHHYAPLAEVKIAADGKVGVATPLTKTFPEGAS